jgi:hypothetical protein
MQVKTIIALAVVAMGLWSAYQILPPLVLALKTGTWQARGKNYYAKSQQPVQFWLGVLLATVLICIAVGGASMLIFGIVFGTPQPA